jgi:signal transduction histidine kinase/CheY-like chemotaxis protein
MEQPTNEHPRRHVEQLEKFIADLDATEAAERTAGLPDLEVVFNLIFENIPADLHLWKLVRDENGAIKTWRLLNINPVSLKHWMKTREETIGKTADEIFPGATEQFMPIVQKIFAEGAPYSWETHFTPLNEYLKMTSIPFGEYFISAGTDVTDIMKAAQDLKASEEHFRALIKASSDVIYRMSPSWTEMRLLSGADFIADMGDQDRTWMQKYIHPDDHPHVKEIINDAILNKSTVELEHRVLRMDGRLGWMFSRVIPILNASGDITEWLGMSSDITERKQSAQELQQREEKYRTLFESIDEGFCIIEVLFSDSGRPVDFVYKEVNPAFERQSGLRNVVGRRTREFIPNLEEYWLEIYGNVALTGESVRLKNPGQSIDRYYDVYAFRVGEPEQHRVAVLFNDVTERERAIQQKLEMESHFRETQRLESLGIMAGGIAHDFNNILMGIMGFAELALAKLSPVTPAKYYISEIMNSARRAAELCGQTLVYAGQGRIEQHDITLQALINETLNMLNTSISKKCVLSLNVHSALPVMHGDPVQVRQILMNLVINASEAIGDRNGVITLNTGVLDCSETDDTGQYIVPPAPGQYVYFEVSDTGCGMDREVLRRIFDPFYTTKFIGRGLGLSAVMGIIRAHKGALMVFSEPGKGTTFKVLFPAVEVAEDTIRAADEHLGWRGEGTVLLVDDEDIVRVVTGEMLQDLLGLNVLTARDGREAVDLYRQHQSEIGVVLLDLTMPHMNGEEAYRELKKINPNVRVVMASGYSETDVISKFAGKDLAGHLQKPYGLDTLRSLMSSMMPEAKPLGNPVE